MIDQSWNIGENDKKERRPSSDQDGDSGVAGAPS
jgi:hypothetical protein